MKRLCVSLILMITLAFSGIAQYRIEGQVFAANIKNVLPRAHVLLQNSLRSAVTNADGIFVFSDLPTGDYAIEVSHLGYQTIVQHIKLDKDAGTTAPDQPATP